MLRPCSVWPVNPAESPGGEAAPSRSERNTSAERRVCRGAAPAVLEAGVAACSRAGQGSRCFSVRLSPRVRCERWTLPSSRVLWWTLQLVTVPGGADGLRLGRLSEPGRRTYLRGSFSARGGLNSSQNRGTASVKTRSRHARRLVDSPSPTPAQALSTAGEPQHCTVAGGLPGGGGVRLSSLAHCVGRVPSRDQGAGVCVSPTAVRDVSIE